MADFKKGSHEFNLPTTAGGQLALKHRKYIIAGTMDSDTFIIRDEDTGTTNTLTPSKNSEYVTASVMLHAPSIIDCFVQSGILENSSDTSTIPYYLNTSNVEFINEKTWNIRFSYNRKNFVISPLNDTTITCKSTSLYRHTIELTNTPMTRLMTFSIIFDIISSRRRPYLNIAAIGAELKSICNNNSLSGVTIPCSGFFYGSSTSPATNYPFGKPNGFVKDLIFLSSDNSLSCEVMTLYKNSNGTYAQKVSAEVLPACMITDTVQFLTY